MPSNEIFTNPELTTEMLDCLERENPKIFEENDPWLEMTCGDGNILEVLKERLLKAKPGRNIKYVARKMLFGVDIIPENVVRCIERVYGTQPTKIVFHNDKCFEKILTKNKFKGRKGIIAVFFIGDELVRNLICANALKYEFNFGEYDDANDDAYYPLFS